MNVPAARLASPDAARALELARRQNRRNERAFGTGYGRSSGYAEAQRRYVPAFDSERFRVH